MNEKSKGISASHLTFALLFLSIPLCMTGVPEADGRETRETSSQLTIDFPTPILGKLIACGHRGDPIRVCRDAYGKLTPKDIEYCSIYIIKHPDCSSYHLLLALYHKASATYSALPSSVKASILCDALANGKVFNDWGILEPSGSSDGVPAKEIISLGQASLKYLFPILDNKSPAILEGSQESTLSDAYHYRKADYAYRYACLILKRSYSFARRPCDRDKAIDLLRKGSGTGHGSD